ncbi:MAG: dihydrodipicolinate synthase family protein [Candidatus Aramenus sulfurataquae]|jgi:4-hydroxy-tetrahydrodipicolinate synthase|uniref:Dihydrodipicolinate synthase family protein n=2 Tax=Candidatus Aramenus sulfurataquae TaxID=1326980 RepID=A0A0F2LS16_9CREN|nr:dihydrodipicolinate synthase family protein [Candidatus Aramenus sulfurataquae]
MDNAITALVTPFDDKENVNLDSLRNVIEFNEKRGISSFWVLGTTGEFNMLSQQEKISVVRAAREFTKGKIYAGVNENSLSNSYVLLKEYVNIGVDAVFSVPPIYHKPGKKGLIDYYEALSKPGISVYVYNIPSYVGYSIDLETLEKLVSEGIISGMKYTTSDLDSLITYTLKLKEVDKNFKVFIGSDTLILPALMYGGDGAVSGIANFAPEIISNIFSKYNEGNYKEALKYQLMAVKLNEAIKLSDYPSGIKIALRYRGLFVGRTRAPLEENITAESAIYNVLKELNL